MSRRDGSIHIMILAIALLSLVGPSASAQERDASPARLRVIHDREPPFRQRPTRRR